jgi:chemotaxis protein CheD
MAETIVRMAEHTSSASGGDVLVTIGLGSCIGLALLDRARSLAGLAHVVLPEASGSDDGSPAKFANTAVPVLVEQLVRLGASAGRLEAVLVGGAHMFSFGRKDGAGLDVGARNEAAVTAALEKLRIPIRAKATGGTKGRTIRVHVGSGLVTVKEAGGLESQLFAPAGSAV